MKYTQFYKQYKDKIFSYFYYSLNQNRALAEDLTSDAFLKGFEKFDTYNMDYAFSTWIFTIARNTLYDYYRKNNIDISLDDEGEIGMQEFLCYEENFQTRIDTELQIHEVFKLMEKIPAAQKEIIVMSYLEDFSHKEISQMTGKTEANIRKILSRGLKSLGSMLPAH